MTVGRPPQSQASQRPHGAVPAVLEPGASTPIVHVLDATALRRQDAITFSARAAALLRAGLAVRAVVLQTLGEVRTLIRLASGRAIVLEGGIYR